MIEKIHAYVCACILLVTIAESYGMHGKERDREEVKIEDDYEEVPDTREPEPAFTGKQSLKTVFLQPQVQRTSEEVTGAEKRLEQQLEYDVMVNELTKRKLIKGRLGEFEEHAIAGGGQGVGNRVMTVITDAILLRPLLGIGEYMWNESKPARVKEREAVALQLKEYEEYVSKLPEIMEQQNKTAHASLERRLKNLDLMERRLETQKNRYEGSYYIGLPRPDGSMDVQFITKEKYKESIFVQGKTPDGAIFEQLIPREMYDSHVFVKGNAADGSPVMQFVPKALLANSRGRSKSFVAIALNPVSEKELIEDGKIIPAGKYLGDKWEEQDLEYMHDLFNCREQEKARGQLIQEEIENYQRKKKEFYALYPPNKSDPVRENLETAIALSVKTTIIGGCLGVFGLAINDLISGVKSSSAA